MSRKLTVLLAVIFAAASLIPVPAVAQSGAVKPGQNKVKIKTVADDIKLLGQARANDDRATGKHDPSNPTAAGHRNALSPEAAIIIFVAVVTTISVIAAARRQDRVCGPLSGCPLF